MYNINNVHAIHNKVEWDKSTILRFYKVYRYGYNFEAVYCHDVIRTQSKNHFIANVQHATIKVLWDICKKENLWKQKSNKSFHNILIILKFLYDSERTTKIQ